MAFFFFLSLSYLPGPSSPLLVISELKCHYSNREDQAFVLFPSFIGHFYPKSFDQFGPFSSLLVIFRRCLIADFPAVGILFEAGYFLPLM